MGEKASIDDYNIRKGGEPSPRPCSGWCRREGQSREADHGVTTISKEGERAGTKAQVPRGSPRWQKEDDDFGGKRPSRGGGKSVNPRKAAAGRGEKLFFLKTSVGYDASGRGEAAFPTNVRQKKKTTLPP